MSDPRDIAGVSKCYATLNNLFLAFQPSGFSSAVCSSEDDFQAYYDNATQCLQRYTNYSRPADLPSSMIPLVPAILSYCGAASVSTISIAARQLPSSSTILSASATTALVPCPSRVVNPTYTPALPLPTNYNWGCPPGLLCAPPQVGCNWNYAPNASYYCDPEHCITPTGDPPYLSSEWQNEWAESNHTVFPPFPPSGNWTNLDPQYWGLDISLFQTTVNVTANTTTSASASTAASSTPISTQISDAQGSSSNAWIAGAVIGPVFVAFAVLLVGFFLLRRRKQRKRRVLGEEASSRDKAQLADTQIARKELTDEDIKEIGTVSQREELGGKVAVHELGPHHEPAEMDGGGIVKISDGSTEVQSSEEARSDHNQS